MRSLYYSSLARLKLALRSDALSGVRRFLRRFPPARWTARALISDQNQAWVEVERGLAQGLWLRLNPTLEADYWLGDHEPLVQAELRKRCRPGAVVFDVGANVGFFSLAIARLVGPGGRVIAFEPLPANIARLKEHATRNALVARIELVETALWSSSAPDAPFQVGRLRQTRGGLVSNGVAPVLADGETVRVPAVSLDDFVEQGHPPPDLIKIDVEGGECEVLKGGERLFTRARPALIVEVHHAAAAEWIAEWLKAKGYSAKWHVPVEGFPRLVVATGAVAPLYERRNT